MSGVREIPCPTEQFQNNLIFLVMEEHESEVLQVECRMECSLVGEQEQRHSAGTDIVDYRRWYLLRKLIQEKSLNRIGLERQCSFKLTRIVQKRGKTNAERKKMQISQIMKNCD